MVSYGNKKYTLLKPDQTMELMHMQHGSCVEKKTELVTYQHTTKNINTISIKTQAEKLFMFVNCFYIVSFVVESPSGGQQSIKTADVNPRMSLFEKCFES